MFIKYTIVTICGHFRLESVKDEKVLCAPGDFVGEVRIVHYKAKNGELVS